MSHLKPMQVMVRTTQNVEFQGEADRISSFNEVGRFDIYPMHANFISIIQKELILYKEEQKVKEMKIEQAVMKVKGDVVHIFLGIEALFIEEAEEASKNPTNVKK